MDCVVRSQPSENVKSIQWTSADSGYNRFGASMSQGRIILFREFETLYGVTTRKTST